MCFMEDMQQHLDKLVRLHRKTMGLSQLELANLAGVGKTVIYDVEHGKKTVQMDTMNKILSALNISVHYKSPLIEKLAREAQIKPVAPLESV